MVEAAMAMQDLSQNWQLKLWNNVSDGTALLAARKHLGQSAKPLLFVTHNDKQLSALTKAAQFFLPEINVITLPAWDCMPYDRSAPARAILAKRASGLCDILRLNSLKQPMIVLTTASSFIQKLPPLSQFADKSLHLQVGENISHDIIADYLVEYGYRRAAKVMETGEFAMRGNIIDLFPANAKNPYRLDLFGETIESIKEIDPISQRSMEVSIKQLSICATSELQVNPAGIDEFRKRYLLNFGASKASDGLYHGVVGGYYHAGMEHYLPYFYAQKLLKLTDFLPNASIMLDVSVNKTLYERTELVQDYYQARITHQRASRKDAAIYNPIEPQELYLNEADLSELFVSRETFLLHNFDAGKSGLNLHTRPAKQIFATVKTKEITPMEYLCEEVAKDEGLIVLAGNSTGSLERLKNLTEAQKLPAKIIADWRELVAQKSGLFLVQLELTRGFYAQSSSNDGRDIVVYSEEDLLGRKIIQLRKRRNSAEAFMSEASSFEVGETLVHQDHGIGRFDGLETLNVHGLRHDCLKLVYQNNDRLFLPVENMDLITRHGGDLSDNELDKLGAGNWQARKASYKHKLRMTAEELLRIAAMRELSKAQALSPIPDAYGDFISLFPYETTEDQQSAIEDVLIDLNSEKPMDRLICGDVGYGKTEVALRAAFAAAADVVRPMQVAFVAPTTLLVRQHFHHVKHRFAASGLNVAQLSRLITPKQAKEVREGLERGTIDVVVGTHALLADSINFARLGLLIVDEEQRFGVKQKEKLKKLKSDIHVLTMSATPIPRTLQMSLTGVRDLSLITTPPVDRLAVRSFVMPYDAVVLKEAITRELHRGGIVFYVTPRIADLPEIKAKIAEIAPNARLAVAHGQMSPSELDVVMNDVYDGKCDILLSTSIIESGIDVPLANTMIINRADRFGLAQLYQLRGRVGRGKVRAYAYFTIPHHGAMSAQAVRRLEVMQSLDSLGAGFTLASHDMDIRGFGNLVGDEQSGHVKEVGIELYQQMLSEAVAQARADKALNVGEAVHETPTDWSPQLSLGLSIFIPEEYVEDLSLRLSLYRRASKLNSEAEIESFAAELVDRFGKIPPEVEHLFATIGLKCLCKEAGIAKIDTGPKGAVLHFQAGAVKKPEALIGFIHRHSKKMKMRPDNSVFYASEWSNDAQKLSDIKQLINNIKSL